jgi:UDP-3-O-[3-hydroxymyristoyl] glucosamine N-acyltransferase
MKWKTRVRLLRLGARFLGWKWYAARAGVVVGRDCRFSEAHFGSEPFLIRIGDRVTVTSGVRFVTHDGSAGLVRDSNGRRNRYGRITIGSDVFLGVNTVLLPGVSIGDRCVIGAGSVVTKSIPPGSVAAGVPARVVGTFEEFSARVSATCPADADLPLKSSLPYPQWVEECLERQKRLEAQPASEGIGTSPAD